MNLDDTIWCCCPSRAVSCDTTSLVFLPARATFNNLLVDLAMTCQTAMGVVQPQHEQQSQRITCVTLDLSPADCSNQAHRHATITCADSSGMKQALDADLERSTRRMPFVLHQPGQSAGLGGAAADAPPGSGAAHCVAVQQPLLALPL